jgi:uncharacterized protein (TIGR02996 family)
MLSDRDALLAAVRANPEEDTPRLMFADWLDEQGDEASATRAEFIRLQCELARLDDGSDSQPLFEFLRDRDFVTGPSADWTKIDDGIHRRIALTMRAEDLFGQHGEAWLPKLKAVEWHGRVRSAASRSFLKDASSSFHRGFPHRVAFSDPRKLKKVAPRLRETVPAVTLIADTFTTQFVEQLADAGLLGWLHGLEVQGDCNAGLWALGHRPEAATVRTLTVRHPFGTDVTETLAESPHWTGLQELDLSDRYVHRDAAEWFFYSKPHLPTLKRLSILGSSWTSETIAAFVNAGFTELTSLRFAHCELNDDAAEVLANCPHLTKLRKLELDHNNITGRGVTALITSPHLANVAFLGLDHNPGNGLDAKRLAEAKPGSLRMFHAHSCRFRTSDVRALARCPRLRTLWYLDLDDNDIGTPAVRELVRGFGKWCPPIVWLTRNRIDDRGAKLLAGWKAASALRVLHLKHNGITDTGIRALLDSPNLANLDDLGVPSVPAISEETEARLKARFKFHIDYR